MQGTINRVYADRRAESSREGGLRSRSSGHRNAAYDAITLKKVGDYVGVDAFSRRHGVRHSPAVIAPDGNTMTITFERKTSDDTIRK